MKDDDQPASSYWLPVGGALVDILSDTDDRILSPFPGMCSKKISKLLQYPGLCNWHFYRFEGEEVTEARALNRHVTELAGLCSWDNLNKTDVILSSSKSEDMEAALKSIVEATSWMDWWTYAMKSLALKSTTDSLLVCHLSLAGTICQLLVAKTASTLWANIVLKRRDTVLAKVKDSFSFESFMDLQNAKLSSGAELFPANVLKKAVERSSKVLHDEAIRIAVAQDKPLSKGKKLHFSKSLRQ